MPLKYLQTVGGVIPTEELGLILPHEHLFPGLRGISVPDYAQAEPKEVVHMLPYLESAQQIGVTALEECSTVGVGRIVQILKDLNEASSIHIVAPTGVYRDDSVPEWMRDCSVEEMAHLWIEELTSGMDSTEIKVGFIKNAMSDDGPRSITEKILVAAAMASKQTGSVVASHTMNGEIFYKQWRVLEEAGLPPNRFIWVHVNLEENKSIHLEVDKIGVFVEFDATGAEWQSQEAMVDYTQLLIAAGFIKNILLSHDAGWFHPGNPKGEPESCYWGYTDLVQEFIPRLRTSGVSEEELLQITHRNQYLDLQSTLEDNMEKRRFTKLDKRSNFRLRG